MKKLLFIVLFSFIALSAMQNNEQMPPFFSEMPIEILAEQHSKEIQELIASLTEEQKKAFAKQQNEELQDITEQQSQEIQELIASLTEEQTETHNLSVNTQFLSSYGLIEPSPIPTTALLQTNASSHKKHQCAQCGKIFNRPSNLTRHQVTHTYERRHKCFWNGCNQTFTSSSNLTRHIKMHTGERPFECTWNKCTKAFAYFSALTRHIRTHTGERPFKCTWEGCTKVFSLSSSLNRHIKNVHKETP